MKILHYQSKPIDGDKFGSECCAFLKNLLVESCLKQFQLDGIQCSQEVYELVGPGEAGVLVDIIAHEFHHIFGGQAVAQMTCNHVQAVFVQNPFGTCKAVEDFVNSGLLGS